MTIQWYGQGCVKLQVKDLTLVLDPFDPKATGLRLPRTEPVIRLLTMRDKGVPPTPGIHGNVFEVNGPGEYEFRGVTIEGVLSPTTGGGERTLYLVMMDGLSIGHLGPLATTLGDSELETLEGVDLLFVPIGGKSVLSAKQASEVVSAVEPRVVIPMYFALPGLKVALDPLSSFTREVGIKNPEPLPSLRLTPKDLPQDETKFFILSVG